MAAMTRDATGRARLLGAGRGLTRDSALASCLGEVAERRAASRRDGLAVAEGSARDLPGPAVAANRLWCFSQWQLTTGPHPAEGLSAAAWAATRATIRACRSWCRARTEPGGAPAFVPLAAVLLAEGSPCDSNGLAAGADRQAAERAALLELAERDAVAIWWYGRVARPPVALTALDAAGAWKLRGWLERRARRCWLLDLTNDLGIPVVAALSSLPDGSGIAYGFAAGRALPSAALAATLELLQSEISLDLAARRAARMGQAEGPAGRFLLWSREADARRLPFLLPDPALAAPPGRDGEPAGLIAAGLGAPVLLVDLDRPGDARPVVRAFAPGLRPWRPRFARGRLRSVPRRLGWTAAPVDERSVGGDVILI